ncbi:MAG: SpoIIE family protein phosphatase [Spirochaetia bacterium]|jgi:serine phosphatase RsbU (regulator of sigma subunit)
MDDDLLPILTGNTLLQGLTSEQILQVQSLVRKETFSAGAVIFRQSEAPDRVHLLAEGKVQVRSSLPGARDGEEIVDITPGSFFGEMAVISGAPRHSSSVVALTPVTTLSLTADDFMRLLIDHPETIRNVLSRIVLQLQGMNNRWLETLRVEKEVLEWKVRERTQELEEMNQRVHRELILAQTIQRNLLPEKRKSFPGITIATDYIPCDELGGDITGVFQIDESRLGVYGGDVCGHGIYAAMVMSYVKKLIETSVKRILLNRQYIVKPPGAVLTAINQSFMAEISQGDPEIYLTLFLGVLDMRKLTFEYSSAGTHVPPLVLSAGAAAELFHQSDFPIGHVANHEYATSRRQFAPHDVFLFVSDGVIEARRGQSTFGMDRLKSELIRIQEAAGTVDVESVMVSVRSFLGDEPPQDDMCLLTIAFGRQEDLAR